MLRWSLIFIIFIIISAIIGFGNLAGAMADMGRIFFFIFVALFLISLIMNSESAK
ncbi:MAG TPA: DUF1328 domain-containing protein [Balneolaceae bacterium]|nr:DUF1328 domain-containing protein [Balneolaceae bacterium]|tara:strand:- start:280 stop:444 length:165 start_codon:yes stop_codon:yes gene_type:complete